MAKIELSTNLDKVEVTEFEPIPEGEYRVECSKEPEVKEGKKAPYVSWQFEIVNHPEYEGRRLTHNTSLSEKAVELGTIEGIKAVLEALDIPWETTPNGGTSFDTAMAPGQEAIVEVSQRVVEDDDGEENVYNDVDAIYPPA